ncbi:MAG: hypothetical protein JAZ03_17795 [Candidatus Thiodiazotropha taylori]|nr:hypothetical protein [Candidatus Thiodiazotropha taylori]MCW4335779.1 hypothetical protein [Candidatus Thiodiazotropha endolucinida]
MYPATLRVWSNGGFESNPPYPPYKKGLRVSQLGCQLMGGIDSPAAHPFGALSLRSASCDASRLVERRVRIKSSLSAI